MESLKTTTKCHTIQGTRLCFKGWEFFVLTSMRWYVESLSRKKKAGGAAHTTAQNSARRRRRLARRQPFCKPERAVLSQRFEAVAAREADRPNQHG